MSTLGLVLPRDLSRMSMLGDEILRRVPSFVPGWRLLLTGLLVAAAVMTYRTLTVPAQYIAEALVVFAPVQTAVVLEPTILSSTDTNFELQVLEHRQALVDLAATPRIEQDVRDRMGNQLTAADRQPGALVGRVHARLLPRSDIISITVQMDFPADALAVANAWSASYIDEVNALYSRNASARALESELERARARRDAAAAAVTAQLRTSRLDAINARMAYERLQVQLLQTPAQFGTSNQSSTYETLDFTTLNELAQTARRLDATRQAAQVMLDSAEAGPGIVDSATVTLLEAQLVTLSDRVPGAQLQLHTDTVSDASAGVRDLVNKIDAARADLQQRIVAKRTAFEASRKARIDDLEGDLRSLHANQEAELAVRTSLTTQRDLTNGTFQAVARKVEERRIAQTSLQREVELASPALGSAQMPLPWRDQLALAVLAGLACVVVGCVIKGIVRLDRPGLTPAPAFPSH